MRTPSPIFLHIGILAPCLPAPFLACAGEEPTVPRTRVESRLTEALGATGNGGGGDAGGMWRQLR